jgi:hypothetical protein
MPKSTSRLKLRAERLAELNSGDLAAVVAGANLQTPLCLTGTETYRCPTLPVANCTKITTDLLTGTETGPSFVC